MKNRVNLSERITEALGSVDYQVEDIVLSMTGEFLKRMEQSNTTRAELARRLGVKPPRVTRILQGNDNFTLRTVVQMADALDCQLVFALAPCGSETRWTHYYEGGQGETRAPSPVKESVHRRNYSLQPLSLTTMPMTLAKVS